MVWCSAWILSGYSSMQNFELLIWKTTELCPIYGNLVWFGMVRSGWFGFELYGVWVLPRCSCMQNFEQKNQQSYGWVKDVLFGFGMVRFGLGLNGMVLGYCLGVVACKISSSWLEKQ